MIALFLLSLACVQGFGDTLEAEIGRKLGDWQADVVRIACLDRSQFTPFAVPSCDALLETGPNMLPQLVDAWEAETDTFVSSVYGEMFARCARVRFFLYSDEPYEQLGHLLQDKEPGTRPLLSLRVDTPSVSWEEKTATEKKLLLEWWSRRGEYLSRDGIKDRLRQITGRATVDLEKYDRSAYLRLRREAYPYGILNIPNYIDIVSEDNNLIIFRVFLEATPYQGKIPGYINGDAARAVREADAMWPTREAKIELICKWWQEEKHTFTKLKDLYQAIDTRVMKLGEELKAKQKP